MKVLGGSLAVRFPPANNQRCLKQKLLTRWTRGKECSCLLSSGAVDRRLERSSFSPAKADALEILEHTRQSGISLTLQHCK